MLVVRLACARLIWAGSVYSSCIWFISAPLVLGAGTASVSWPPLCNDQGINVYAASNFTLSLFIFFDLDRFGIFSLGCEQEVLDFLNFARHGCEAQRERMAGTSDYPPYPYF